VLHEFPDSVKLGLIKRLQRDHPLNRGAIFLIGGIGFENQEALARVRGRCDPFQWDDEVFYWCAEGWIHPLEQAGFAVQYEQISSLCWYYCSAVCRLMDGVLEEVQVGVFYQANVESQWLPRFHPETALL
jgi:hypothetical protein